MPRCLLSLPIQAFLAFPFYLLLIGMLASDVINGCRQAENPRKAVCTCIATHTCIVHACIYAFCRTACPCESTYGRLPAAA